MKIYFCVDREILALGFNEKFIRTWEYYFDYCGAGFKSLTLGNYQVYITVTIKVFEQFDLLNSLIITTWHSHTCHFYVLAIILPESTKPNLDLSNIKLSYTILSSFNVILTTMSVCYMNITILLCPKKKSKSALI